MSDTEQPLVRELLLETLGEVKEIRSDVTEVKHGMGDLRATAATNEKCLERAREARRDLDKGMTRTHDRIDGLEARVGKLEAKKQRAQRIKRWLGSKIVKVAMAALTAAAGVGGGWLMRGC